VVSAILADTAIDERHKRVLLDIYESFRSGAAVEPTAATKKSAARRTTSKRTTTPRTTTPRTTTRRKSA
jgi:hypothetical protein